MKCIPKPNFERKLFTCIRQESFVVVSGNISFSWSSDLAFSSISISSSFSLTVGKPAVSSPSCLTLSGFNGWSFGCRIVNFPADLVAESGCCGLLAAVIFDPALQLLEEAEFCGLEYWRLRTVSVVMSCALVEGAGDEGRDTARPGY